MPPRIDALIIWGNGLPFHSDILSALEHHSDFRILKIFRHRPLAISDFVWEVYAFDYAPIDHLRGKIQYLLSTPNEVFVVFFQNLRPDVDYFGEGNYRHEESTTLKIFKESLRDQFNPRVNGERTHNHVVHATDNPLQADRLLKYLGIADGVEALRSTDHSIFSVPHHIRVSESYKIRKVILDELTCGVMTPMSDPRFPKKNFETSYLPIRESIQFRSLIEGFQGYESFLKQFLGDPLTDYYSVEKFKKLSEADWKYLGPSHEKEFISVVLKDGTYRIVDGLHRAAILLQRGVKEVDVVELK